MRKITLATLPHRRLNVLTGEWVLVSPQRTERPWQGEVSSPTPESRLPYDPTCYLCPGNERARGNRNPRYDTTFVFTNDFSALLPDTPRAAYNERNLLVAQSQSGQCRVVDFSPRHDLTLAEMRLSEIEKIITAWQGEYRSLASNPRINYVQIFENKGALMGNSNPHPHCQIWAQESIPTMPKKELRQMKRYYLRKRRSLLADYLKLEMKLGERIVFQNDSFVALVPFWAVWPYETLLVSRRKLPDILRLSSAEKKDLANILSAVTIKYDNLFATPFPYSAGLHQAPTDGKEHPEWHLHMHFFPPLLRSASVKKHMVGYEMLAEPQRDITPEQSARILSELPTVRYSDRRQ